MSRERRSTGLEAFNRLFWDTRLNRDVFIVGYSDRVAPDGVREVPLVRWDPKGDVPAHRILYIRCGTEVVWSRGEAVDRLASDDLPAAAWLAEPADAPPDAIGPGLRARSAYRHEGDRWELAGERPVYPEVTTFRLATWNVMNDFGEPDVPSLESRLPFLRAELARAGADIVALQEVTPALARDLLATPRSEPLFLSEPPTLVGLDPHGPFLLSRYCFSLAEHAAGHRPVPVGTWKFADRLVHVANVHLPSNRTEDAALHRRRLLASTFAALEPLPGDVLLVGDFNITGDELGALITAAGYRDVWNLLHPGEEGSTFDPLHNPLARQSSRTGLPVRFDRVLWKPAPNGFSPVGLELFATSPHVGPRGPCFASDHYGLCSGWQSGGNSGALAELPPAERSALAIVPPAELWPSIQAIRERYDRQVNRWMPHINLLYGFIPQEHFAGAAPRIAHALADLAPFEIVLEDCRTFSRRNSCTAWLRPVTNPPDALRTLQARLEQLFPRCTEQSRHSPEGFTPHLTIGQFKSAKQARESLPAWAPVRWRVDRVALLARAGDEPFRSRFEVPLGGGEVRGIEPAAVELGDLEPWLSRLQPELTDEHRDTCRAVLEEVGELVTGITGQRGAVHLAGSWRLGVAGPNSDVDAICLHPPHLARGDFLQQLHDKLTGRADDVCLVASARMPRLSFRLRGQRVDILAAGTPLSQLPSGAAPSDFTDAESWQAARACVEADRVLEVAERAMPLPTFRQVLRAVRVWAAARQIHGNAWGFLGGFPWALLTAWSAHQGGPQQSAPDRTAGPGAFLAHFFRVLTHHPWPQPVALTADGQRYQPQGPRDRLPVVRPFEPFENTAYNVTRSTARILCSEWSRTTRLLEQGAGGEEVVAHLFAPINLREESEQFLVLSLTGDAAARADLVGQVEGHIVGLLIDLERNLHLLVRPWPEVYQQGSTSRVVIGLPVIRSRDQGAVRQRGRNFLAGLTGVGRVKWHADICDRASDLLPNPPLENPPRA
jgi:poly(A) polymerase